MSCGPYLVPMTRPDASTLATPSNCLDNSSAWSIDACESTVPDNATTWFTVLTLILKPLVMLSANKADFTFVVIQLSETTRPVFFAARLVFFSILLATDGDSMLLSTLRTPSTVLASSSAASFASDVGTVPVSETTPLALVTLISESFRRLSSRYLAFTLAVMAAALSAVRALALLGSGLLPVSAQAVTPRLNNAATEMALIRLLV